MHDALDRAMRALQHLVVVAVHRDIGVHIAVAGMHVQRDPNPALEHALVHGIALVQDGLERQTREDGLQRRADLRFPARAQGVVLQLRKQGFNLVQPALPQPAHLGHQGQRLVDALLQQLG